MILIALVILGLVLWIMGVYVGAQNSVTAMSILKADALGKLNTLDGFYYVDNIDAVEDAAGGVNLQIRIAPNDSGLNSGDFGDTKSKIERYTSYTSVAINVSG